MLIKSLDVDGLMPNRKDVTNASIDIFRAPNKGFNECVSLNDKLELVLDDIAFAKELYFLDHGIRPVSFGNVMFTSIKDKYIEKAKHLKSTLQSWAKIGIAK